MVSVHPHPSVLPMHVYMVVGYQSGLSIPTVYMYGCYSNRKDAEKKQIEISGGKKNETWLKNETYIGINNTYTWINEIELNKECLVDVRQPYLKMCI